MKIKNLKVKTAAIPSRTAACQFIDQHGYDMEWMPEQGIFYVHDLQKNQLHAIAMAEVTNFSLDVQEPAAFMAGIRDTSTAPASSFAVPEAKRGPGRPRRAETPA